MAGAIKDPAYKMYIHGYKQLQIMVVFAGKQWVQGWGGSSDASDGQVRAG